MLKSYFKKKNGPQRIVLRCPASYRLKDAGKCILRIKRLCFLKILLVWTILYLFFHWYGNDSCLSNKNNFLSAVDNNKKEKENREICYIYFVNLLKLRYNDQFQNSYKAVGGFIIIIYSRYKTSFYC